MNLVMVLNEDESVGRRLLVSKAAETVLSAQETGMKWLLTWRQIHGFTKEYVAGKIGATGPTLKAWESCVNYPSSYYLPLLAEVYGCTIEELFLPPPNVK